MLDKSTRRPFVVSLDADERTMLALVAKQRGVNMSVLIRLYIRESAEKIKAANV